MTNHTCKNCQNNFDGNFCNVCGQKVVHDHDKSFRHLAEEAFHFITHLDSKFWRTLKSVMFRTGKYAYDYTNGARARYFKPVSLFLIVIIAYLLFPLFSGLNMKFNTYMDENYSYSAMAKPIVQSKLEKGMTYTEVQTQYDIKSGKFSKFLLLLYLPLTALLLQLLFFKRKKYYYDHFILSTELNSFFIVFIYLFLPLLMIALSLPFPGLRYLFKDDGIVFKMVIVLFFWVTALSFKRFYHENWLWTAVKSIVFILVYNFGIKFIYSIVLFYLVMLFI